MGLVTLVLHVILVEVSKVLPLQADYCSLVGKKKKEKKSLRLVKRRTIFVFKMSRVRRHNKKSDEAPIEYNTTFFQF